MEDNYIKSVDEGSPLYGKVESGDTVIAINGNQILDVLDYKFFAYDKSLKVRLKRPDGSEYELDVKKSEGGDLGLNFESYLMDKPRSCSNACVFCFIDQLPRGMRKTMYFKDDDARLSFLLGNYITLTNLSPREVERIIALHISPINVSVQTTNPELRCKMLHNRFAGEALKKIDRLYEAGTPMNGQVVMCKNLNDGDELDRTIRDLTKYIPCMESVSVVPVGLSKYRDGLYPLEPITAEDAAKTIDIIEKWQKKVYAEHGIHFIHASDEFYILAGRELPEEERYDGYIQLENGVGMIRLLTTEVHEALDELEGDEEEEELSIATGKLAAVYLAGFLEEIKKKFPNRKVHLYPIRNDFFGEMITVAGLITGQDLIAQLKDKLLGSRLLLPECMFRSGEEVFLDDITRQEVENALQVPVNIVKSSGQDFVNAVLHASEESGASYEAYELKEISYE